MLARTAGRRQRRHTSQILAASFAQLNLPWLAPAQLRWTATRAAAVAAVPATQPAPRIRRRSASKAAAQARAQIRELATAADTYTSSQSSGGNHFLHVRPGTYQNADNDENVPWDFSQTAQTKHSTLRPFTNEYVMLNTSTQVPEEIHKVQNGVQGTILDLLQHLHTSLKVGRIKRAEGIIHRLAEQSDRYAPELLYAHQVYLQEMLSHLAASQANTTQAKQIMVQMQKWFEKEVQQKGALADERILITMIKAACQGLVGSTRDRAIRRYADIAAGLGEESEDEVLYSEEYDDNEFTILEMALETTGEHENQTEPIDATRSETQDVLEQSETAEPGMRLQRDDPISLDELPDVLVTEQKGEGLSGIKKALDIFATMPALPRDAPIEEQRKRAYERQMLMEETSIDIAVDRWRKEDEELRKIGITTAMQSKPMGALMWQWFTTMLPALEKELAECREWLSVERNRHGIQPSSERDHYGPYLELLPLRKLAANTILDTMQLMVRGKDKKGGNYEPEVKLSSLCVAIGNAVEQEVAVEQFKAKGGKSRRSSNARQVRSRIARQLRAQKRNKDPEALSRQLEWSLDVKAKLGAMLVSKLIDTAQIPVTREHPRTGKKVTQMQPAFLHGSKWVTGKRWGMVKPNPSLMDKIQSEPVGTLIAKRMPMIVEPKPWTSWNEGGYLKHSTPIVRLSNSDRSGKNYIAAAHEKGDMDQVYAGLTALGRVPWKINKDVLKAQIEAWNSGEAIANFAPLKPHFEMPPEPEPSTEVPIRRKWLQEVQDVENKRIGLHSKRCFQNFQLEIARAVVNETLYFPHNLDFRGRAYPVPPYLNHMGADNARGLLVFSDGRELGEGGLRWLKVHLANVAGYDKASLQEREDYTMAHLDDIYDSVRNTFSGRKWWLESEDAWQTLAACFELTNALDSPDPTKFVSHLPIHQDGTCNGLQHYAALGGDKAGAAQVNLEPSDRPADIYTAVMNAVVTEIEKEVAENHPIAKVLQGKMVRKFVKQPVMTNVYGVTFYGAKAQVKKQIEEYLPGIKSNDAVNYDTISLYIATKIFKCLGDLFTGAQAIQRWLGICADRISTCLSAVQVQQLLDKKSLDAPTKTRAGNTLTQETIRKRAEASQKMLRATVDPSGSSTSLRNSKPLFRSTVVWTTPLRLPVAQPYRAGSMRVVSTNIQALALTEPQIWDPVSKRKQLQAFPPNFIHSLDATHMLLSALKCSENGMTFASIHDSFWTHACDIDKLSTLLRDAFVAMHSEDIIGRLREEFVTRYQGCMYLSQVIRNSPAGVKIQELRKELKAKAIAKTGKQPSELELEVTRLKLLASDDPAKRKQGQKMVTPASILDSATDDETTFVGPTEMEGQQLGDIPANAELQVEATDADVEDVAAGSGVADDEAGLKQDDVEAEDVEASEQPKTKRKTKKQVPKKLYVWRPLEFPPVPEKGGFDVTRLKQSKYFFH